MAKDIVVFPKRSQGIWNSKGSLLTSSQGIKLLCAHTPHSHCCLNSIRVLVLCSTAEHTGPKVPSLQASLE